jgi:TPR repeat protein
VTDPSAPVPRRRRVDLLTSCFALLTVLLLALVGVKLASPMPLELLARRTLARLGHAQSAVVVALAYADGKGVTKEPAQALAWFERAADAGAPEAMVFVGDVAVDARDPRCARNVTARAWYRRAADVGHFLGAWRYGLALANGVGGEADPNAAVPWLEAAVESTERGTPDIATPQATPFRDRWIGAEVPGDVVLLDLAPACPMHHLGRLYDDVLFAPRRSEQAADWYRRCLAHDRCLGTALRLAALLETRPELRRPGDPLAAATQR